MSRIVYRWGPPVAWASLILIGTSIPIPRALASEPIAGADKLVHATLYAVLAWLSCRAVGVLSTRAAVCVIAATSIMGALDEWHQTFIPGRSATAADWIADTIGAGTGVLAFQTARRRRGTTS